MPERGDLLLVPFPFTDLSSSKRRPVLAITRADAYGDFVALPVTSRRQEDYGIPLGPPDLISGALPVASWIRTNRVVTLNASLVVKTIGRVSAKVTDIAVSQLCEYLGHPQRR